jgi:hypothetical protein
MSGRLSAIPHYQVMVFDRDGWHTNTTDSLLGSDNTRCRNWAPAGFRHAVFCGRRQPARGAGDHLSREQAVAQGGPA